MVAKSDWLTIETLYIANHLNVEVDDPAEMARNIRRVFQEATEKLATKAIERQYITMGEVADAVA